MLGFFYNIDMRARFSSTSSFRLPSCSRFNNWHDIDARHGRVLFRCLIRGKLYHHDFRVWDPVANEHTALPVLSMPPAWCSSVAVLCAGSTNGACDHLHCHGKPFLVVFLAVTVHDAQLFVQIYSSQDGTWSEPTYYPLPREYHGSKGSCALVGKAIYFVRSPKIIIKYSLETQERYPGFTGHNSYVEEASHSCSQRMLGLASPLFGTPSSTSGHWMMLPAKNWNGRSAESFI